MKYELYDNALSALEATNKFYSTESGFQYTEELVEKWISSHVKVPKKGRVLDLCCGDGIWSRGFQIVNPELELFGIDIAEGGIEKARKLLGADESHFVAGDADEAFSFEKDFFDLIFARGPGLYNQHSMDRPATIAVIERWHESLKPDGVFYSIFASDPKRMGTYTDMENSVLPYNRSPRKTAAVDFSGGKYHHSIETFMQPFWKACNVRIVKYSFFGNLHVLITGRSKD